MYTIAHRGAAGVAPENTMLSFWTALSSKADIIEFDVQITNDEQLVVFHDKTMERIITGDTRKISDLTLHQLKEKDVGKWKGDGFSNKMPTLNEVLTGLPRGSSFIIEIKPQGIDLEANYKLENMVVDELQDTGVSVGLGYISVRHESSVEWLQNHVYKPKIGLMQKKRSPSEFIELIQNMNIEFAQIRVTNFNKEDYSTLKSIGAKIIAYPGDTPTVWDELISNKVDGIITNYPGLLHGYLSSKKK